MKIGTIIVDDEKEAREGLKLLLADQKDIKILKECSNGLEAIKAIEDLKPDLVFLDIQMPRVNGFEVIASLQVEEFPEFIFVTAFNDFALKAFEIHALDFLLKPFTDERFTDALNHARKVISNKSAIKSSERITQLTQFFLNALRKEEIEYDQYIGERKDMPKKLIIKSSGKIIFVDFKDIIWIEAYDYYVKIHIDNRFYVMKETMKAMERHLPENQFMRISRFAIVNIEHIDYISRHFKGQYLLTLKSGMKLKVGQSFKQNLKI